MALSDQKGAFTIELAGQAVSTAGGAGSALNPFGESFVITQCTLVVLTPSAGAANINVGTGLTAADNNNLIAALAVNGSITNKAYNGPAPAAKAERVVWAAGEYITATTSAASTAFVGRLYIKGHRV